MYLREEESTTTSSSGSKPLGCHPSLSNQWLFKTEVIFEVGWVQIATGHQVRN